MSQRLPPEDPDGLHTPASTVFDCYDSQNCKPKFYDGHFNQDIDYNESEPTEETMNGYIQYLRDNDDELPENYYQRRKAN